MRLQTARRMLQLLKNLARGKAEPAVLPMRVQKRPFPETGERSSRLPRCSPEAAGVPPECLERFLKAAAGDMLEDLHGVTVLRHGKVIAAYSVPPYDREVWHVTHSLCKTVTALAVGILIGAGKLHTGDRIVGFFPEVCTPAVRARYGQLTVYHLLTMTAGASFCELQSVTEYDWVRGYFESPPLFSVGERFHYNSMNSYLLAAIVYRLTGNSLSDFLRRNLFGPMGIRQFHWETCPKGIEKGGWGLYLLQEDAAKLGQLIVNRGKWNGMQLVPAGYMESLCAWHSDPPREMSRWGYGYQCWVWKRPGSVRCSGLFGQHVLAVPDLDMVIAANAGSGCLFGESRFLSLCSDFLEAVEGHAGETGDKGIAFLHERAYTVRETGARLLPLTLQVMENCYTAGIHRVRFFCKDKELYIETDEGSTVNRFPAGLHAPVRVVIAACGEQYRAAVQSTWQGDCAVPQLTVKIAFLEQACTRILHFLFCPDGTMKLKMTETPGSEAVLDGLRLIMAPNGRERVRFDKRLAAYIGRIAQPELTGFPQSKTAPDIYRSVR